MVAHGLEIYSRRRTTIILALIVFIIILFVIPVFEDSLVIVNYLRLRINIFLILIYVHVCCNMEE